MIGMDGHGRITLSPSIQGARARRARGEGGPALMYGAENTISVSAVLRYAPLRMINAGFQSSPALQFAGTNGRKEGSKGMEGSD